MKFRTILGFLIVLIVCSCAQRTSKGKLQTENRPNPHLGSKSGLLFEHYGYNGTEYTDSLGINYNLRSNPITITNDSTIRIHVQIAFSKEYDYPNANGDEKFKVFPMPKEWAIDGGGEITDNMFDELKNYIDKPLLNETIEPGENFVFAIGTLFPKPVETWSVVPNELFALSDRGIFPTCDWLMKEDQSSNPEIALGVKLVFLESCMIIPCGQISYPN